MHCFADILTVNRKKEEPPLVLGRMFFEKVSWVDPAKVIQN